MSNTRQVDFIIVGLGLAGSCLASRLIWSGKSVMVFDTPESNRASSVAAGLFNPVTGKYMAKTWRAADLFQSIHQFYPAAEKFLSEKFFFPMPLYRPFVSAEEQNEWMGKSIDPQVSPYIENIFTSPSFAEEAHDPYGGLLLKNCGYIDTNAFISATRKTLETKSSFQAEAFDDAQLETSTSGVSYRGITASKIIFCNGTATTHYKFFSSIPIRPLKGEVLLIRLIPKIPLIRIYNRGVYVVPTSEPGIYKVGATYAVNDKSTEITPAGKEELIQRLNELIRIPYEVIGQDWGMRPTTPDRRPVLGATTGHPNVVIFNGLGTKGVSLAPFFSDQLVNWLAGLGKIDPDVHVDRFYKGKKAI